MLNRTEGEPKAKAWLRRAAVWLLWIALWQAIAAMVRNPIIFVGPFEMLRASGISFLTPYSGRP